MNIQTYRNNSNELLSIYVTSETRLNELEGWEALEEEGFDTELVEFIEENECSVANHLGVNYAMIFHETEESFLKSKIDQTNFAYAEYKSLTSFNEDDNMGYMTTIDGISYYKVRNSQMEAVTVSENGKIEIHY